MATLSCDCYSYVKGSEQYGKAGDVVTVISTRGEVLIVENSKGVRFPVHTKKVEFEAKPVVRVDIPVFKLEPVRKVRQVAEQTNLF